MNVSVEHKRYQLGGGWVFVSFKLLLISLLTTFNKFLELIVDGVCAICKA